MLAPRAGLRGPRQSAPLLGAALAVALAGAPALAADHLIEQDAPLDPSQVAAAGLEPLSTGRALGFTGHAVWVRLRLENPSGEPVERVLTWEWPLVERLDAWVSDGAGGFRRSPGGLALPLAERTLAHAAQRHIGTLRVPPGPATDVYLRVATRGPMLLEARVWVGVEMVRRGSANILWVGAWSGALLVLVAAALWTWRLQRDRIYLEYALFCAGLGAYQLDMTGVVPAVLPWVGAGAVWLEPVLGALATVAGVEFTRRYLDLERDQPLLDRTLRVLAWITGLACAPVVWDDVVLANQVTSATGGPAIGMALAASVVQAWRGRREARWFLLSFGPFALAGGWYVATLRGQLPPSHLAQALFQATFLMTGLSVGLALSMRRRAEEARNREFLEAAVADRSRALDATVARLGSAQRLEAVGRLTAGVAHDFNNLLTAIAADVGELQREQPAGAPDGEVLQEIRDLVRRGGELTRSLLLVARRQPLEPHPVVLNQLVEQLVRLLERLVKGVAIGLDLDAGTGTLLADPGQLEQVVLNLVLNARDACDGRGHITVSTRRIVRADLEGGRSGGEWVLLTVADDGPGMDERTRERIFEPFFTTKGDGKGTGLGLSVVDGVARAHGGFVEVASAPGQGATFGVWLPAGGAPRPEAAPALTPAPGGALTATARSVT